MPAPKVFLTCRDIADVTGMSLRSAQYLMYVFTHRGQVVHFGPNKRGNMVDINILVDYLCQQDGADPKQRKLDIQNYLRERGNKHTSKDICE